jgi:hypothetical protein
MLASDFFLVARFGVNVPRLDDWFFVPAITGDQPITAEYLWSQWNEHRLPLPRLVLLALYPSSHFDFRSGMFFNVSVLGLLSAAMIVAAARLRGRQALTDAFFPLALLNWSHSDNFLWSWQVGFVLSTFVAGAFLLVVVLGSAPLTKTSAIAAGACLLALPLCGANAVVMVPPLILWMLVSGLVLARSKEPKSRHAALWLIGLSAAAGSLVLLYFVGYNSPRMYDRPAIIYCLRTSIEFLASSLGAIDLAWWWPFGIAVVATLAIVTALSLRAWQRWPHERFRASGLLAFLAAMIGLALALGWGRAGFGQGMGLSWRYVTLAVPCLCSAYFAFLLYGGPLGSRIGQAILFLASAALLWHNTALPLATQRLTSQALHRFERDVKLMPPIVLIDAYKRDPVAPYPLDLPKHKEFWHQALRDLHRARIGVFRDMPEDPSYRVVPLDKKSSQATTCSYELKSPLFVYAVRVRYLYERQGEPAVLVFSWGRNAFRRTLPKEGKEDEILIWVNGPLERFDINPDFRSSAGKIISVELLVPDKSTDARP